MYRNSQQTVLLTPRPYAQLSGRLLLLPLLPTRKPLEALPSEIWSEIYSFGAADLDGGVRLLWAGMTVCKMIKNVVLPILYTRVEISRVPVLEKFCNQLRAADQKWDSIRRIPYSAPGRWVQVLDLSQLMFTGHTQALLLDSLLTCLFPLMPFLSRFSINPSFIMSRRALRALAEREGTSNIRYLEGISYVPPQPSSLSPIEEEPLVQLIRSCTNLEELKVIDQGPDPAELEFTYETTGIALPSTFTPLHLPRLRVLTLLSMHSSPLMLSLLLSPLPSLEKLTITPYDDIPYPASYVTSFITAHGATLRSLLLITPKSWPTRLHPSPSTLLESCPRLRHLSLECPIPSLKLESTHPLRILSVPRPSAECWSVLEGLFPQLPSLRVIRAREVRWLRKGMTLKAQEAGVQGELREWTRRLSRRGIRVLDADWNDQV